MKKTELQRVIEGLEAKKAAIQETIDLLKAQQASRRKSKRELLEGPIEVAN